MDIPIRYVSNINLIEDDILEISCFKGYKSLIESKLTLHMKLVEDYNIDSLFSKHTNKENLKNIIPMDLEKYINNNEKTIQRLESVGIKASYRKYLRIINNKIKEIVSRMDDEEPTLNESTTNTVSTIEPVVINPNENDMNIDKFINNTKRNRSTSDDEVDLDEFNLNSARNNVSNDQ